MNITKSALPNNSLLKPDERVYDYVDSFQGVFTDKNDNITSTEVGKSFFLSGPRWVGQLLTFRNRLVGFLGLKTSGKIRDRQKMLDDFRGEKGEKMGLFKVFDKTMDEIVLGEDDKHLNFRVSLLIDRPTSHDTSKKLIISTTVKFNNWLGRVYFLPVRPFHQLIVPVMLKGIIKHLEKQN